MDRLTSLTTFVRVVDSGGFSAAGRRLNMSTTMVSNHIQALEDRLGARLLNRTTRKVSLTEVGKAYYDRCTQILADLEQADESQVRCSRSRAASLRIYTATHVVPFVAPVVAEFLKRYPEVKVDLTMGERTVDMIDEGFDLAIRLTPPPDSSLIVRSLATWRHVLCCSPGYIEATRAAAAIVRTCGSQLSAPCTSSLRGRVALRRPQRRPGIRASLRQSDLQQWRNTAICRPARCRYFGWRRDF